MGKALYRKYRSKSLDEIVGQPHITTTLKNALKSDAISHAYLFTGPRGTGKTSIARILAHEVNQLPYDEQANHLDIIEIDAASNRRIDEIRELRERVHTAPTSAKYKVYIIDEVHMLTKEAFNALLKTLEEPPAHVIFILATTEAHKLPETIVSRTQRFTFKPVEESQVIAHLKHIADQEKAQISDDALQLIAQHGGGSFRDSISLLDQVRGHSDSVTIDHVQEVLGIAPEQIINELISVMQSGGAAQVVTLLRSLREQGYQAGQLARQLAAKLRSYLIEGTSPIPIELVTVTLQKLLEVPAAHDPEATLELALLHVILAQGNTTVTVVTKAQDVIVEVAPEPVQEPIPAPEPLPEPKVEKRPKQEPKPEPVAEAPKPKKTTTSTVSGDVWAQALETIKKSHNTLYSVARMATPEVTDDEITLTFGFAFHQKRINEVKNKQVLTDILQGIAGKPIILTCVVGKSTPTQAAAIEPPVSITKSDDTVSTISNIFGGAEVLES